jgi:hypothetical protein
MPSRRVFAAIALALAFAASSLWVGCSPQAASDAAATAARKAAATSASKAPPSPAYSKLEYTPIPIGAPVSEFGRPIVTNVEIVDLDQDGLPDILYCEAQKNTIRWIRQFPRGVFTESIIAENISGPAHVWAADVNGSGRLDVLVASMGQIWPNNDKIGALVVLENLDNRRFQPHVLLEHVERVTDVRAARFVDHPDRRQDLVVAQFGYYQGQTQWLENLGGWQFKSHVVNTQSGCINVPVADFEGRGKMDFAAVISQEWEEIHLFRNSGNGEFQGSILWGSTNEDFGSSGLAVADVNRDGRPDLIYTNGDGFDYALQSQRPWHGVQWIENTATGFKYHRIGDMPGAFSPCAADLNGDGFIDLVTVSCFADWTDPSAVSLMAWINDGHEHFTPVVLAHKPIQLVTAAVGDLDGNGVPVIVTGGFHTTPPFENMSSVTLWRRK